LLDSLHQGGNPHGDRPVHFSQARVSGLEAGDGKEIDREMH
jgi:hypothetical protein